MTLLDYLLFPIYTAIFYFVFAARRKKYTDSILAHYHKIGFWVKIFAVFAFSVFNGIISKGDSLLLYFTEGYNIRNLILSDFSNIKLLFIKGIDFDQSLLLNSMNRGYFRSENNYLVTKLAAFFGLFGLGKYAITNLFFGMIAFSGSWRLFKFFYELYPNLHKQIAIAILYLPTFVFWSSGILKDSFCIASLGWLTYALYEGLLKKKNIVLNVFIIIVASYLLTTLKAYILVSYLPFFFMFLFLKNMSLIKSKGAKVIVILGLIIVSMALFTKVMGKLTETIGEYAGNDITQGISKYQGAYSIRESASSFSLGVEFDGSFTSLLKLAPAAVVATLFRPFIWESKSLTTLLSSIESLFVIYFTLQVLFGYGLKHFFSTAFKEPTVLFCLLFSLLFALFVGATTGNFGSLVRYKIPCMPFYMIAIFIIQYLGKHKKSNPVIKVA